MFGTPPSAGTITITTPAQYSIKQRSNATQGTLTVTGTYTGSPASIEARFNGGSWATLVASPSGGTYTGTLTATAGQGTLEVRFSNNTTVTASRANVGIGDLFCIAGQSNASGIGTNNQSWSHATLTATRYQGSTLGWTILADPTNSEDGSARGSWAPPLATQIMAATGLPVGFVSAPPRSGTGILSWREGNGSGRYESMRDRINAVGGVACVLWWQGENDAGDGMTQATYNGQLDGLANELVADTGAKLMPCKLQNSTFITPDSKEDAIRAAIGEAWADNTNVLTGPDFSDLDSDDNFHLTSDANLQTAADRWFTAIDNAGVLL